MRLIELIYNEYKKALSQQKEVEGKAPEFKVSKEEVDKILKTINKIQPSIIERTENIEIGNVYEYLNENLPIFFTILDKTGDLYIALVMTPYWQLSSDKALIVDFEHPISNKFAVLPIILNLDEEFIKNEAIYIGKLRKEDIDILQKFYNGEIEELPKDRRGLSYPEGKGFYQEQFLKDEIERTFKLQAFAQSPEFWEEEAIIELPPERLEKQLLAAGEEKTVYRGKNFTLFYNKEEKILELELAEELIDKPAALEIFGEKYEFENLPKVIQIAIPEEFKDNINIDYIGQNITIKEVK